MEGLVRHFKAVLDEGPAIIYNVPGRTGQDIPDNIIHEIAAHSNFLGVKECTGNQRIQVIAPSRQSYPLFLAGKKSYNPANSSTIEER